MLSHASQVVAAQAPGCRKSVTEKHEDAESEQKRSIRLVCWTLKGRAHHLVNLRGIELLNIPEDPNVIAAHKVDGDPLASVSARSPDSVDVQLSAVGQVVVDDQRHLQQHSLLSKIQLSQQSLNLS